MNLKYITMLFLYPYSLSFSFAMTRDVFFSADDYIGTCVINVPEIAVHGRNGWLNVMKCIS